MAEPTNVLTAQQIADLLGVTSETVRSWVRNNRLQGGWLYGSRKLGYRIARAELARFLRDTHQADLADRVERGEAP